jgi:indolepyruvate ferredoxin oxidoreductase beta subunit
MYKNVLIAGVGGQGSVLASKVLGEAARIERINVIVGEVFGVSQRGGSVVSHIRLGKQVLSPLSLQHDCDVVCGFELMESLRAANLYIRNDGTIFTNIGIIRPIITNIGEEEYPRVERILKALSNLCKKVVPIDGRALAEQVGGPVFTNMVLLGALSTFDALKISLKSYEQAISLAVPKFLEKNLKAFHLGRKAVLT